MAIRPSWLPWQTYAGLTLERLQLIATILRHARDTAVSDHKPHMHESGLSLGVRAWERGKGMICALRPKYTWLHISNGAGLGATHFIFQIGGFACRFYHGDPEDPPTKYRSMTFEERGAAQQVMQLGQIPQGHALRFSIVTGSNLLTSEVHLIEYVEAEHRTVRSFQVPVAGQRLDLGSMPAVTPIAPLAPGVSLEPPSVGLAADAPEQTTHLPAVNNGTDAK